MCARAAVKPRRCLSNLVGTVLFTARAAIDLNKAAVGAVEAAESRAAAVAVGAGAVAETATAIDGGTRAYRRKLAN